MIPASEKETEAVALPKRESKGEESALEEVKGIVEPKEPPEVQFGKVNVVKDITADEEEEPAKKKTCL